MSMNSEDVTDGVIRHRWGHVTDGVRSIIDASVIVAHTPHAVRGGVCRPRYSDNTFYPVALERRTMRISRVVFLGGYQPQCY